MQNHCGFVTVWKTERGCEQSPDFQEGPLCPTPSPHNGRSVGTTHRTWGFMGQDGTSQASGPPVSLQTIVVWKILVTGVPDPHMGEGEDKGPQILA